MNRLDRPHKTRCSLCAEPFGWRAPIGWWITASIEKFYDRDHWNRLTQRERRTIIKHTEQAFDHQQLDQLLRKALEKALAEINTLTTRDRHGLVKPTLLRVNHDNRNDRKAHYVERPLAPTATSAGTTIAEPEPDQPTKPGIDPRCMA